MEIVYFITAFLKSFCVNGNFELNVLVIYVHFRYLFSSGALLVSMRFSVFHLEPHFRCSVPDTFEVLLE